MSASAFYIMDLKGRVLISRDYRGDINATAVEQFTKALQEVD